VRLDIGCVALRGPALGVDGKESRVDGHRFVYNLW